MQEPLQRSARPSDVSWDKSKELAIAQKILQKFHCSPCDPPGQCPNITQNAWGAEVKSTGKKPGRCYGFHDAKKRNDRRRVPFGPDGRLRYWSDSCPKWRAQGRCSEGDACFYAHTEVEQLYHPSKYKTAECEGKKCWGDVCAFIHKPAEARRGFAHLYARPVLVHELPQQVVLKENWWMEYKTRACSTASCPKGRYCMDAHPGERRRPPFREDGQLLYEAPQAENELEFYYHPEIFRREFCPSLRKANTPCTHERLCHRAHSMEEFLGRFYHTQQSVTPQAFRHNAMFMVLRWKTVPCPWLHWPHIWARCPYHHRFHNQNMTSLMKPELDWRRVLFNDEGAVSYRPEPCVAISEGRSCPNGNACENTHTKAEFMYHPEKYRRRECQFAGSNNCPRGIYCAFIHPSDPIGSAAQLQQIMLEFNLEDVSETLSGSNGNNAPGGDTVNHLRESSDDTHSVATSLASSAALASSTTPPLTSDEAVVDEEPEAEEEATEEPSAGVAGLQVTSSAPAPAPAPPLASHLMQLKAEVHSLFCVPWLLLEFLPEDVQFASSNGIERAFIMNVDYVQVHTFTAAKGGFAAASQQLRRLDNLNRDSLLNCIAAVGYVILPRRLDRPDGPELALLTEFFPQSDTLTNAMAVPSAASMAARNFAITIQLHNNLQRWSSRAALAKQLVLGVCSLHEQQFFLGNLRSSNVLIALDWEKSNSFILKIAALGAHEPSPIPPEMKNSFERATAAGDVFNFGIVLQELLTLVPALDATGARDDRPLAAFLQRGGTTHAAEWADLVRQCCVAQVNRRPSMMAVERIVSQLAEVEASEALAASTVVVPAEPPVPSSFHAPKRKTLKAAAVPQPAPTAGMALNVPAHERSGK